MSYPLRYGAFAAKFKEQAHAPPALAWPALPCCSRRGSSSAVADTPPHERLQDALRALRTDRREPAAGLTIPPGPTIEPGSDRPSHRAPSPQRLAISGDLPAPATRDLETYNETLQSAVLRFQARHGLEQDALIGKRTLKALNVPVEQRIRQIHLNVERTEGKYSRHNATISCWSISRHSR